MGLASYSAWQGLNIVYLTGRSVYLYDYSQWDHIDAEEVDIVLLDDIFGRHQLDAGKLDGWRTVLTTLDVSKIYDLGPVVQSVISLTSSLRVISLTVLADSIHNILKFFAEKM